MIRTPTMRPHFGFYLAADAGTGACKVNGDVPTVPGSLELAAFSSRNELLLKKDLLVCPDGIKDEQAYLGAFKDHVVTFFNELKHSSTFQALPIQEKLFQGLGIVFPGPVQANNMVPIAGNLTTHPGGEPLKNIDFNSLATDLSQDVDAKESGFQKRFLVANDMMGVSAQVAGLLRSTFPKMKAQLAAAKPVDIAVVMTGGGFGASRIHLEPILEFNQQTPQSSKVRSVQASLIPMELGFMETLGGKGVEESGACAPAMLRNFGKSLGLEAEKIKALSELKEARFVTQSNLTLLNDSDELDKIQAINQKFREQPLFDLEENGDRTRVHLANFSEEQIKKAAQTAMETYLDRMAQALVPMALSGVSRMLICGKTANGVNEALGGQLEEQLRQKIYEHTLPAARPKLDADQLRVKLLSLKSNTHGVPVLLDSFRSPGNEFLVPGKRLDLTLD